MRNNEDRFGVEENSQKNTAAEDTTAAQTLAPLEFVRPKTLVDLPSGGVFYSKTHPMFGKDTIEIRQMTTAEEDILTNRSLLKKGTALDVLLERVLVDAPCGPNDLLVSDKNAVLIQTRIDGYGPSYKTKVQCPNCSHVQKKEFNLNKCRQVSESVIESHVKRTERNTFEVSLDNGWQVEIKPLTGKDETYLTRKIRQTKNKDEMVATIQEQLFAMIVSVSGHREPATIKKAIDHMTGLQSRVVREAYRKCVPNINLRSSFECVECEHSTELEVPLNAEFFWSNV